MTPEQRRRDLRAMKRRATALLVVVAGVFVVATLAGDSTLVEYARAAAEGGMVGGLADWFAVTALFRHPLGLPIPHTAVVRERKDQFGETLGEFVQSNFLNASVIGEKVRSARVPERLTAWLCDRANAETVARHVSETAVGIADVVADEDVHRLLDEGLRRAVDSLPVAGVGARILRMLTDQGRHQELLDAILRGLETFLDDNRETLRERFGREAPWWLPGAVEDRIFERLLDGFTNLVRAINDDPDHELRRQFDVRVAELIVRLEEDPALIERAEHLKRELLAHPELRRWTAAVWVDAKRTLRDQATDPSSELRRRLADAAQNLGDRVSRDPDLLARIERAAEGAARTLVEQFHDEIADLVSGTIARWDAEETSDKLELLLGRDLQFIRINGTVVGALAGMAIHAAAVGLA